jgi:uncharacterized protein YhbP (UPF0306 family)
MRSNTAMTSLNVQFNHPAYRNRDLAESITDILNNNIILAMATVHNGDAYVNSAHYAYNDRLEMVIFTHPHSEHGKNLIANPSVAVAIWKRPEAWGMNLQGVQLFGTAARASEAATQSAIDTYSARFPQFSHIISAPEDFERGMTDMRLYVIQVEQVKLIDETRFGHRNWITVPVIHPAPQPERDPENFLIPMI